MAVAPKQRFSVEGLCTAPVTPFAEDGLVKYDAVKPYIQHLIDFGIPNVFVNGTLGEAIQLNVEERKKMAEKWIKEGKGKLSSIIINIGAGNLVDSQELARHAEKIGADAIACVAPTYYKQRSFELYVQYMAEVSAAAPKTPFFLYDVDFITGITYEASEFLTRGRDVIPMLVGVKHSTPSFVAIHKVKLNHPDMMIFLGTDEEYLEGLSIGVRPNIISSYNGHILNRLVDAFDNGDFEAARLEQSRVLQLIAVMRSHGLNFTEFNKAVLRAMELEVGSPRLPLKQVNQTTVNDIKKDLTDIGFFKWGCSK